MQDLSSLTKKEIAVELVMISRRLAEMAVVISDEDLSSDCYNSSLMVNEISKKIAAEAIKDSIGEAYGHEDCTEGKGIESGGDSCFGEGD